MNGTHANPVDTPAARETRVLLVDDDRELCQMLTEYLSAERFEVSSVHDGGEALRALRLGDFDVLRELGAAYAIPILMLTARGDDVDRIVGLELGADDYLGKPFNPRELVARVRAILRRVGGRPGRAGAAETLEVGPITLNTGMHQARVHDQVIALTGAEFRVLELLMRASGQVLSREALTEQALGRKLVPYDRSIDTHISNLRRKLDLDKARNPEIKNVRGSGYMLTTADA